MHLPLDGRGPLHAQLTRALKTALAGGRLGQGSRLPPTRALARSLMRTARSPTRKARPKRAIA